MNAEARRAAAAGGAGGARARTRSPQQLRSELGLGEPFADPGVGAFGLHNAVYAIGDTFLEVVSPTQPDTTAGRYLDRHGDGGYMVIFQLADLDAARERAAAMGDAGRLAARPAGHLRHPPPPRRHARGDRLARPRRPARLVALGRPRLDRARGNRRARPAARRDDRGERPGRDRRALGRAARASSPTARRLVLDGSFVRFEPGDEERLTEVHVEVPGQRRDASRSAARRFRLTPPD